MASVSRAGKRRRGAVRLPDRVGAGQERSMEGEDPRTGLVVPHRLGKQDLFDDCHDGEPNETAGGRRQRRRHGWRLWVEGAAAVAAAGSGATTTGPNLASLSADELELTADQKKQWTNSKHRSTPSSPSCSPTSRRKNSRSRLRKAVVDGAASAGRSTGPNLARAPGGAVEAQRRPAKAARRVPEGNRRQARQGFHRTISANNFKRCARASAAAGAGVSAAAWEDGPRRRAGWHVRNAARQGLSMAGSLPRSRNGQGALERAGVGGEAAGRHPAKQHLRHRNARHRRKRVYAYFGMHGLFCYDFTGKLV